MFFFFAWQLCLFFSISIWVWTTFQLSVPLSWREGMWINNGHHFSNTHWALSFTHSGALSTLGIKALLHSYIKTSSHQQPGICELNISKIFNYRYHREVLQTSIAMVKWDSDLFHDQPTIVEESLVGSSDCWHVSLRNEIQSSNNGHDSHDSILLAIVVWYILNASRYLLGKAVQAWNLFT